MPIIIKTCRGSRGSYTDYDIKDPKRRANLRDQITRLHRQWREARQSKKDYYLARLKFIGIKIIQALQDPDHGDDPDLDYIWEHYHSKGVGITSDEELMDPDELFAARDPASQHRQRSSYKQNKTASVDYVEREAPPSPEQLGDNDYMRRRIHKRARDIQAHAANRVKLLFLLCTCVWGSKRVISLSDTELTPGKGDGSHKTVAAHSSLYPAIHDVKAGIQTRGQKVHGRDSIIDEHFRLALNNTVKLPTEVNEFDKKIEGKNTLGLDVGMRQRFLPYLNKVSQGELHPLQAISCFYQLMLHFFEQKNTWQRTVTDDIADFQAIGTLRGTQLNDSKQLVPTLTTLSFWLDVPEERLGSEAAITAELLEAQTAMRIKP